MELKFASYNVHKAVGLDRRRDPGRILDVIAEIGADVVAIQEADRRFGRRIATLPRRMLAERGWQVAPVAVLPDSIGWHGNALLVREGIAVIEAEPLALPTLEPRGAVRVDLAHEGRHFRVIGMHLDLSGLRRRQQLETIFAHLRDHERELPTIAMGDLNEWLLQGGCFRAVPSGWSAVVPGASFPTRQPVARLDRFLHSPHWAVREAGVHLSPLAGRASDHLPVRLIASLLPNI